MYAASKGGMNAVTRTMAVEWGPHNIQVNAVCPTVIMTPMGHEFWDRAEMADARREKEKRIPMHRFGEPHEVADLVLYLASPASDYINGVAIPVDGGLLASP
jgi:2-deoxy-D-gluconate 3-dehydrogenase